MNLENLRGKFLLSVLLGMIVVVGLGIYADFPKLAQTISRFDWRLLPAILGLTLLNYGLRFVKWQFFLRVLDAPPLPTGRRLLIWVAGLSMVVTPGKVGEWLKSYLLREETGMPISASAPIVLGERLSDALAMALLASGGLILYGYGWQTLAGAAVLGCLAVGLSQYRPFARWLIGTAARVPFVAGRVHQLEAFYESTKQLFHWRSLGLAVLIGVVSWAGEGAAFYLVLVALGAGHSTELLVQAVFILSTATIAGGLSMVPGGLVVADGGIAGLLLLLGAAPDRAMATAATIIIRFATLWFGVSIGLIALGFISRRLQVTSEPAK
jgi:glycosyltransferase 2 family protein